MPLTPEQIAKFDAITGLKTSSTVPPTTGGNSLIDRIRAIKAPVTGAKEAVTAPVAKPSYVSTVAKQQEEAATRLGQRYGEIGGQLAQKLSSRVDKAEGINAVGQGFGAAVDVVGAGAKTFGATVGGIFDVVSKYIPENLREQAVQEIQTSGVGSALSKVGELNTKLDSAIQSTASTNPEIANLLQSAKDVITEVGLPVKGAGATLSALEKTAPTLKRAGTVTGQAVKEGAQTLADVAEQTVKGVQEIGVKTPESILTNTEILVDKAIGNRGKKGISQTVTGNKKRVDGLEAMFDEAPNITVKDADGVDVPFIPTKTNLSETAQALIKTKQNVFSKIDNYIKTATNKGVVVSKDEALQFLDEAIASKRPQILRSAATRLRDEVALLETPSDFQQYIQDLNTNLGGVFNGTVNKLEGELQAGLVGKLNKSLDSAVDTLGDTGELRALKNKYSALKSIESDLGTQLRAQMRQRGSGLSDYVDIFSTGDMISGVLSANPVLIGKALAQKGLTELWKLYKDPNRFLNKAFENIAELKKLNPNKPTK